jgi:hypothetical protein
MTPRLRASRSPPRNAVHVYRLDELSDRAGRGHARAASNGLRTPDILRAPTKHRRHYSMPQPRRRRFHNHSITSSARASSVGGTSRPRALALVLEWRNQRPFHVIALSLRCRRTTKCAQWRRTSRQPKLATRKVYRERSQCDKCEILHTRLSPQLLWGGRHRSGYLVAKPAKGPRRQSVGAGHATARMTAGPASRAPQEPDITKGSG